MSYRAEATSVEGFVQQIACCYLRWGYWFFVTGWIPIGKDPQAVDEKLIAKYGIAVSESTRARRKRAGLANLQYIRHESFFLILATKGQHRFFEDETELIRDVRKTPIKYAGYSISYRPGGRTADGKPDGKWHSHVVLEREQYLDLKLYLTAWAMGRPGEQVVRSLRQLPVQPYAPVRRQLLRILRDVNASRRENGHAPIDATVLTLRRQVVRPFGPETLE